MSPARTTLHFALLHKLHARPRPSGAYAPRNHADASLTYAVHNIPIKPRHLIARIGTANTASIALFERLGFGKVKVVEVWSEAEMRWGWTPGTAYDDAWADAPASSEAWPESRLDGRVGVLRRGGGVTTQR